MSIKYSPVNYHRLGTSFPRDGIRVPYPPFPGHYLPESIAQPTPIPGALDRLMAGRIGSHWALEYTADSMPSLSGRVGSHGSQEQPVGNT